MRRNVAVVLAGGSGRRMESATPKQFLALAGRLVIEHAVEAFQVNESIDEIAIVGAEGYESELQDLVARNGWSKVGKLLVGGRERYHSSLAAIRAYAGAEDTNLIFHDAARPLVSQRIIDGVARALEVYSAVCVAVKSTDTVLVVEDGIIRRIPDRRSLMCSQTPQAFRLEVIAQAYDRALRDPGFAATDDCGVVLNYLPGVDIHIVCGEEKNMKLTYKDDIRLMEALIAANSCR